MSIPLPPPSPPHPRVLIIGAGPSGLTCLKTFTTELQVPMSIHCYERSSLVGGVWNFNFDINHFSVYQSSAMVSSKETTGFSDFPIPSDWPSQMNNSFLAKYFRAYAKHFRLKKFINFQTKVTMVERYQQGFRVTSERNYGNNKQYKENNNNNNNNSNNKSNSDNTSPPTIQTEYFDYVIVSVGYFNRPSWPQFPGQNLFQGTLLHSQSYKNEIPFSGQKVLIVGIGNGGAHIAPEVAKIAEKTYLSSRSGGWIAPTHIILNTPIDHLLSRVVVGLPRSLITWSQQLLVTTYHGNMKQYNLTPKLPITSTHPIVSSELLISIKNQKIMVKKNIERFTRLGVVFEDDTMREVEMDTVIFATGHELSLPFLSHEIQQECIDEGGLTRLYKHIFPLDQEQLSHLYFVGYAHPVGSILPISEMMSRLIVHQLNGKYTLPKRNVMERSVKKRERRIMEIYKTPKYNLQVDFIPFMDSLARRIGAHPTIGKVLLRCPLNIFSYLLGPARSSQFRLFGPNRWEEAGRAMKDKHTVSIPLGRVRKQKKRKEVSIPVGKVMDQDIGEEKQMVTVIRTQKQNISLSPSPSPSSLPIPSSSPSLIISHHSKHEQKDSHGNGNQFVLMTYDDNGEEEEENEDEDEEDEDNVEDDADEDHDDDIDIHHEEKQNSEANMNMEKNGQYYGLGSEKGLGNERKFHSHDELHQHRGSRTEEEFKEME